MLQIALVCSAFLLVCSLASLVKGGADYWSLPIPAQGPPPAETIELVADLSAPACGICHVQQFADWQESWHARSVSPGLLGQLDQLDGGTVLSCLACHAPREEAAARWWTEGLKGGAGLAPVDCTACHVRAHIRYGPRARSFTPHGPVIAESRFRKSDFCAPCHQFSEKAPRFNGKPLQDTYAEWRRSRYAKLDISCQACHMPGGRHRMSGIHDPELTRRALGLSARRTAAGLEVHLGNQGAGHALPTYVTPRLVVTLAGITPEGMVEPLLNHVIARQMEWSEETGWRELADTRLLPDQWQTLTLALPAERRARVKVQVDPGYDYHQRVYPALLHRWAGVLEPAARDLLEQARLEGVAASYTLIELECGVWSGQEQECVSVQGF